MTFGQKLKQYRGQLNITQKELAEKMNVTFQTISKWESDINEPDFATVRKLAKILNCTIEDLLSDSDEKVEAVVENPKEEKNIEEIENSIEPLPAKKEKGLFHKITNRNDKKPLIWAIVLGIIASIIGIAISVTQRESMGIGLAIALPFIMGYCVLSVIYCIFTGSYISGVFVGVATWSIKFPGLIWQFSLGGFMWLIAMKILFAVIGFFIGILVFFLALGLSTVLSVFSFVPVLIYNKKHYY